MNDAVYTWWCKSRFLGMSYASIFMNVISCAATYWVALKTITGY